MDNIIIVGGGIAAINAAKAIREVDPNVTIDLFGDEKFYPYYRTKLSKNLLNRLDADGILLQPKEWYTQSRVNLHLNIKVQGIDVERQEIILPQAKRLSYTKLLLANGAGSRPLTISGADKANTIRNLADIQKIQAELAGKQTVLFIGGGVLGLEIAWLLQQYRKKVIIAEIQNRLFPNQLDERAAALFGGLVESFGIKVLTNTEIGEIIGDQAVEAVEAVETKEGAVIPCDMVFYSTGIKPNIDICQGTPIRTRHGVIVDDQMRTNVANIYAAGDVAEYQGKVYGLLSAAAEQGKTAGYNMAGHSMIFQPVVPVSVLNAFRTSLFSMGDISETGATRTFGEEDPVRNTYRRIFVRDNAVCGAIIIGDNSNFSLLKKAIEQKTPLDEIKGKGISLS